MIRSFLLTIFFFHAVCVSAQSLKGNVHDGEYSVPLDGAIVMNLNTRQSVFTDKNGAFIIAATAGDQISFTAVGYKSQQKTVPSSLGVATMSIDLFKFSFQLEEFVLRPYTTYQVDSIERHSTYQRSLARQKGGSIMSPVTFIAEKLSRSSKQIFKFQRSFNYWEDQKFIESRYSPELVTQLTKLQGDTLAWFMNAHPMPYDYARVASELEIKLWIREHYKEWLQNPQYFPIITNDSSTTKQ